MKLKLKQCECTNSVFTNTHENGKEVWICVECFRSILKSVCTETTTKILQS